MRTVLKDSTDNVASLYIVDTDGVPKTSVAYNAAGLAIYRTPVGGTQVQITLSADNWTEKGNGRYEVDVADSVYTAVGQHDFDGSITDGHVIGERQDVVAERLVSQSIRDAMKLAPSAGAAAAGSLDAKVDAIDPLDATETQAAAAAAIAAAGIATEDKQDEILADIAAIVPAGGIYTQTVTVKTTGGAAIPNATVAIYSGSVLIDTKATNSSGIAQPMCDAGSYTLRVAAAGYASYSAALAVTGDATLANIELEAFTSTPSTDPDSVTVRWRVKKADRTWAGSGEATVYIQIVEGPGTDGIIWHGDNEDFDSKTTDVNGYVNFTDIPVPCTLGVRTGTGRQLKLVSIPEGADDEDVYDAGELISHDA